MAYKCPTCGKFILEGPCYDCIHNIKKTFDLNVFNEMFGDFNDESTDGDKGDDRGYY